MDREYFIFHSWGRHAIETPGAFRETHGVDTANIWDSHIQSFSLIVSLFYTAKITFVSNVLTGIRVNFSL